MYARVCRSNAVLAVALLTDSDLQVAIDGVARGHLGYDAARTTFSKALRRVKTFEKRDAIASAHTDVMIAMDRACYYAGLSWAWSWRILERNVNHRRLKRELPAKGISRFINEAVRARLRPGRAELDKAYEAATREPWRQAEA